MATKNIIPRNNNEGKIGTNSKKWAEGHFESLSVAGQSVSGGGATALTGLTDVTITNPQNNQLIRYDDSSNMWVNVLLTTDDLNEGSSNLYFTNARSRSSISASSSGSGSLTYNSSTGALTYTGPSNADIRTAFTPGTGISISSGEISIGQSVGTTDNVTFNNLLVNGNLTVSGTTTTINTETINLADNNILLNSNYTGSSPSENCGIEVERGAQTNKTLVWNETTDKWTVGSETFVANTFEGNLTGNVTGNVTGTVSSIANHDTDDLSEGSSNLYFTNERVDDRVNDLLTLPSNSNLSLTYDDNANTLSISAADIAYSTKDIFILGGSSDKTSSNQSLTDDYGIIFRGYDNNTNSAKNGFFGYDEAVDAFVFYESISNVSNNHVTPNQGNDLDLGKIYTSRVDLKFRGTSTSTGDQIRFYESSTGGTDYIGIKSPHTLSGNYTLTLPGDAGSPNQVLKTDGSGVLSWVDQASGGSGDIEGVTAGNGLSGGGTTGTVTLDLNLNELTAADVNVANDSIAIIDDSESNGSRKESIADLITAITGSGLSESSGVLSTSPQVIAVTVSGGNFLLDGVSQKVDTLVKGVKYRFDQSDGTNGGHPLAFSTASDGGGSSYTTGVTTVGSPGNSGAYTEIIVPHSAPSTLYYYCTAHSGMGSSVKTEIHNTDQVSEGSSNLYFTNERVDDRVDALIIAGTGISKNYNDSSNTLTLASDATLEEVITSNATSTLGATFAKTGVGLTSTGSPGTGYISTQGSSNHNLSLDPQGSGVVVITGNATRGAGKIKLNCGNNSHGVTIQSPPHSAGATYTLTLPANAGSADQVLKTDGSGNLSWVNQSSGGGGGGNSYSEVSSTGTLSSPSGSDETYIFILTGNAITVTLPTGVASGIIYNVKNVHSSTSTVSAGTGLIDGVVSINLNKNDSLTLVASGSSNNWYIL